MTQKRQEIGIKFVFIDCSNFEKGCSGDHFASFLSYYYCKLLAPVYFAKPVTPSPWLMHFLSLGKICMNQMPMTEVITKQKGMSERILSLL